MGIRADVQILMSKTGYAELWNRFEEKTSHEEMSQLKDSLDYSNDVHGKLIHFGWKATKSYSGPVLTLKECLEELGDEGYPYQLHDLAPMDDEDGYFDVYKQAEGSEEHGLLDDFPAFIVVGISLVDAVEHPNLEAQA